MPLILWMVITLDCLNNKYGRNCALDCQCYVYNTLSCDPVSGNCSCKSGWTGDVCTEGKSLFSFTFFIQLRVKLHAPISARYLLQKTYENGICNKLTYYS